MHNKFCIGTGYVKRGPPEPSGVDYMPSLSRPLILWDYARSGKSAEGASLTPTESLNHRPHFMRANAEWFLPFVERMAAGEDVTIEEINAKHLDLFGKPLQALECEN